MPIVDLDHVALPAQRMTEMISFYQSLGFRVVGELAWRAGQARVVSFELGTTKLNVHPPETWSDPGVTLRAPTAVPGSADICVRFVGSLDEAREVVAAAGAAIIEGPVSRVGGRGEGTSLYVRDPDGNLLELIVYADRPS